jgi:tetratricopeptide (TPR) repeat protein
MSAVDVPYNDSKSPTMKPHPLLSLLSPVLLLTAAVPAIVLLPAPTLAQTDSTTSRRAESIELNNRGRQLLSLGRAQEALPLFEQALVIVRDIGERQGEGVILNNIGLVYRNLGQYERALEFFEQALAIRTEVGDRPGEGTTLNNIGAVYRNLGQYERALEFYEQALAIRTKVGDRPRPKAWEGDRLSSNCSPI